MNKIVCFMSVFLLAGGPACASESKASVGGADRGSGKLQAPVSVEAAVRDASADVTVGFDAEASAVEIAVRGVDGLKVTSAARPVLDGAYAKGSRTTLKVFFSAPAGQSNLAVSVRGVFAGVRATKVVSFTVGTKTDGKSSP
jgi:hypothetical protein